MQNEQLKILILKIGEKRDKNAFNLIFDYFAPRILGYLIGSGTQKDVAEEITQEALTLVWQKAFQFDSKKGNVSTWIFTITRNRRIDRFRKNKNFPHNTIDLIEALYPEEKIQYEDSQEKVRKMQEMLNEKEKKLIKMNFFEGKTHKIISKDLEIPLGTVKSRIRNILIKMKNL
jgi:RNA polymerase sigma-70 factor (ECF subfamily)